MENISPIQITEKEDSVPGSTEKAIIADLIGKFSKRQAWRQTYENLWEEVYRLYFSQQAGQKVSTRSSVTVPIVFQIIEAAVPKIVTTIFGNGEEYFDVVPVTPEEDEQAEAIKALLTYQLAQADFMIKFVDFCKQLLMYGTSYFYVYWKVERDWVYTRTPHRVNDTVDGFNMPEQIQWEETKEYGVVRRRPEVEILDILDVFPDPEARSEKDGDIFVRSWMPMTQVKEMGNSSFPMFANTDSQELVSEANTFSESRKARYAIRSQTQGKGDKDMVELLTFWGRYDLDNDGIKEKVQIVIANRTVLFVARANPFHHQKCPVIRCVFFPVPLEWYGMGLIEPVITNVKELWTLRRQRLDNINLIINRMWKVNSLSDIDLDTLVSTPNGIILTDTMDGVEALPTPDVTQSAYNEASIVQSDIENATTPRSIQGAPDSGRLGRTARGAQLIVSQALEKFAVGTKLIEEMALKRVIKMFHQLNLQFIDDDRPLQDPSIYGAIFNSPIQIEHLRTDIRFKMVGISDMVGTEGRVNQLISFFGTFAPYLDGPSIESIAKKIARLQGMDPSEIIIMGVANKLGALTGNQLNPEQNAILGQVQQNGAQSGPPQV